MTDTHTQPAVDSYGTHLAEGDHVAVVFLDLHTANTPTVTHLLGLVLDVDGVTIRVRIPEAPAMLGWDDGDELEASVQGDFTYRLVSVEGDGFVGDDLRTCLADGVELNVFSLAGQPTC